ncbi:hypothetical protein L596_022602 [Steinernema carpocapsae]|uniref:Uncharacterized protein n=1 Tax=Steinernema carpocapsae TaxID=34508 RepID=A0A4U5MM85_STECR|nr:hypothetical protein L596_022602 [Steinernema carpocapsae]
MVNCAVMVKQSKECIFGQLSEESSAETIKECIHKHKDKAPTAVKYDTEQKTCSFYEAIKSLSSEKQPEKVFYFLMPENANACSKTDLENCQTIIAAFKCPEGFERQVSDAKNVHNCLGIVPYGEDCPGHSFLAILRDETLNSFAGMS